MSNVLEAIVDKAWEIRHEWDMVGMYVEPVHDLVVMSCANKVVGGELSVFFDTYTTQCVRILVNSN